MKKDLEYDFAGLTEQSSLLSVMPILVPVSWPPLAIMPTLRMSRFRIELQYLLYLKA